MLPGFGASSTSVATVLPPASTVATDHPAIPSSCGARPVRTAGSTWRANPASGASSRWDVEADAGQLVDGVLHPQVVRLAEHRDGIGAAVGGARRTIGDGLRGDGRLDRRERSASAPVTAGRSPACSRSSRMVTTGVATNNGTPARSTTGAGSAGVVLRTSRWRAASCGCTTVGAQATVHAGPSPPPVRRRPTSPT